MENPVHHVKEVLSISSIAKGLQRLQAIACFDQTAPRL